MSLDPVLQVIKHYEALMNEASMMGDPILFGDSVHPSQQVPPAYGWFKTGVDKVILTTAARKRLNIMGALNLETMKFIYQDFETINSASALIFLKKVEEVYLNAKTILLSGKFAVFREGISSCHPDESQDPWIPDQARDDDEFRKSI